MTGLTIKMRLYGMFAAFVAGMLLVGGVGFYQMASINTTIRADFKEIQSGERDLIDIQNSNVAFKTQVQEWKNILLRGNDPAAFDKYQKGFEESETSVRKYLNSVLAELRKENSPLVKDAEELLANHAELGRQYREALSQYDKRDLQAGKTVDHLVKGMDRKTTEGISKLVDQYEKKEIGRMSEQMASMETGFTSARNTALVFLIVLIAAIGSIVILTVRQISSQVANFQNVMLRVGQEKDLTLRVPVHGKDELSQVGECMNALFASMQDAISHMSEGADSVARCSQEMASSVSQLATSVETQNDATSSMAAAVEELSVSVNNVSGSASEAQRISTDSSTRAADGGRVIEATVAAMGATAGNVQNAASVVERVGDESREITGIVQAIRDVADQTNLLALNAAIEAARAGEQGRGFAVVADEVRKLAEKTGKLTENISNVVARIQGSAQAAVGDMRRVVDAVAADVELAAQAGSAVGNIREGALRVVEVTLDISASLKEQSLASENIAQKVERIAQMSEENTVALGHINTATARMSSVSREMHEMVARFRIGAQAAAPGSQPQATARRETQPSAVLSSALA